MTILGVPDGSGFTIGTSSNIASTTTGGSAMDVSLDDMIKQRRAKTNNKKTANVDRTVGRGRAKRQAAANARRGISDSKTPSKMEVEKEVKRETRRSGRNQKNKPQAGRRPKSEAAVKAKEKQDKRRKQSNKKSSGETAIPPTWIGGVKRPPSKKAVTAAVVAMKDSGFKVPKGMQMVISFAPAPNQPPTNTKPAARNNNKGRGQGRGNNNSGRGGGRGRGRGKK
eukprot:CAMPEP_0194207746 /NCGR_PEP_ID=MMETSP0156-20130528/6406_1 /TAXON_ID=33649 /ORGANISM="Thalassionema nitzschioides, Strain L26-B" /LENGTH=224 /DNA_ID=CAMNT_0038934581 /DNA_START=51 /DNA_END=725 /DNA_ORIENTATION=-